MGVLDRFRSRRRRTQTRDRNGTTASSIPLPEGSSAATYDADPDRWHDRIAVTPVIERNGSEFRRGEETLFVGSDPDAARYKSNERASSEYGDGVETDAYAGDLARRMIENGRYNATQPYWLGFDRYGRQVSLDHDRLFRHLLATGRTGVGKSTVMVNLAVQHAERGYGFAMADPGGEAVFDVLRALPEETVSPDRVIWLDPAAEYLQRATESVVGFNFLRTTTAPGDPGYPAEKNALITDLLAIIDAEHPRMRRIAKNVFTALIEANATGTEDGTESEDGIETDANIEPERSAIESGSDGYEYENEHENEYEIEDANENEYEYEDENDEHENEDESEYEYTLVDAYWFLAGEERRQKYAALVREEQLNPILELYADEIAAMSDELEPLLGRFDELLLNDTLRPLVASRHPRIDFTDVVENGTILLAKLDVDAQLRRAATMLVARKIWTVVTARPMPEEQGLREFVGEATAADRPTYDPYFLILDEFHSLVHEDMDVQAMLAEARKRKLGLFMLTQQLDQIPDGDRDANGPRSALLGNTNKIAFNPGDSTGEQRAVASAFRGVETEDLDLGDFRAWVAPRGQQPLIADMLAPYPPRRSLNAAYETIVESVSRHGIKRAGHDDLRRDLDRNSIGTTNNETATVGGKATARSNSTIDPQRAVQAFYDEMLCRSDVVGTNASPNGDTSGNTDTDSEVESDSESKSNAETNGPSDIDGRDDRWSVGVRLDETRERLTAYCDALQDRDAHEGQISQLINRLVASDRLATRTIDGTTHYHVTPEARAALFDVGSGVTQGGPQHLGMAHASYRWLVGAAGYHVEIPDQDRGGSESVPELIAREPVAFPSGVRTRRKALARHREADESRVRHALSGGEDAYVECENSTLSNPAHLIEGNAASAIERGKVVLFVVAEDTHDYQGRGDDPEGRDPTRNAAKVRQYMSAENRLRAAGLDPTAVDEDDYRVLILPDDGDESAWDDDEPRVSLADGETVRLREVTKSEIEWARTG